MMETQETERFDGAPFIGPPRRGRPVGRKTVQRSVTLQPERDARARAFAKAKGWSFSFVVDYALAQLPDPGAA